MTKKFHARPLVGEKYRHNLRKEIYIVERVREKSVSLTDANGVTQIWLMGMFMTLVNAGMVELVEGKSRGTFA